MPCIIAQSSGRATAYTPPCQPLRGVSHVSETSPTVVVQVDQEKEPTRENVRALRVFGRAVKKEVVRAG